MDLLGSLAVIIQGRLQYAEINVREQPGHLLCFLLDNRQTALTKNVVLNIREQQIIIMSCNNLKLVLYVDVLYKIS